MNRRDTIKVLGSIPFLAFGGAIGGCNHYKHGMAERKMNLPHHNDIEDFL